MEYKYLGKNWPSGGINYDLYYPFFQVAEEKANQRETHYKEQIKTLTTKLKQAEARSEFAEKSVQKLQKEVRCLDFDSSVGIVLKTAHR
jgi:hypothetical protein